MGLFGSKGSGEDRGPRDAAERERARLEREARRAAREGRPAPAPPPREPDPEPPAPEPEPPAPEPEPLAPEPVPPPAPRPDPPAREPEPDFFAAEPEPEPEPEPESAPAPPPPPAAPAEPTAAHEPAIGDTFDWEAGDDADMAFETRPLGDDEPTGVRRIGGRSRPGTRDDEPVGVKRVTESDVAAGRALRFPGAGGGGHDRPGRRIPTPGGRRPRLAGRLLLVAAIVVVAVIAYFLISLFEPFAGEGEGSGQVSVTIPEGASAGDIGDILAGEGVVDSGFFFGLRARLSGDFEDLRAGQYTLAEGMSISRAIDVLTTPPEAAPTVTVTIPEGRSRKETVTIIEESGLRGDYLRATREAEGFNPQDLYDAPEDLSTLEGFLFPATYELRRGANVSALVQRQVETFQEKYATVEPSRRVREADLTPWEILIIASMIEREAAIDEERKLISAVIHNRLEQGIPLGIDATIRFRLDQWSEPLKQSELEIDSDYNTRTRQGLPPGPIGNPGLASLKAAARPSDSDALYYVVKPCGNGAHAFSDTDAEFQEDVAAYNRAREARGGRDPSDC